MTPQLAVVANNTAPASDSLAARIRRLQMEARALAKEQITALEAALEEVARLSSEVANGGDAFPVGAREVARQLAEDAVNRKRTLDVITERTA